MLHQYAVICRQIDDLRTELHALMVLLGERRPDDSDPAAELGAHWPSLEGVECGRDMFDCFPVHGTPQRQPGATRGAVRYGSGAEDMTRDSD